MNDKADEKRQHITVTTLFSQAFLFYLFILLIFVQGLDTFMTAWAWQMYSFDRFKHMKKILKAIRLVQNYSFYKKIIVFNQDLSTVHKAETKILPDMLAVTAFL